MSMMDGSAAARRNTTGRPGTTATASRTHHLEDDDMSRVREVSPSESRVRLRFACHDNGLSYRWLTQQAEERGHQWVGDWLEEHNFYGIAESWRNAAFLHDW
jgi:hypothetical protein